MPGLALRGRRRAVARLTTDRDSTLVLRDDSTWKNKTYLGMDYGALPVNRAKSHPLYCGLLSPWWQRAADTPPQFPVRLGECNASIRRFFAHARDVMIPMPRSRPSHLVIRSPPAVCSFNPPPPLTCNFIGDSAQNAFKHESLVKESLKPYA